MSLLTFTAVLSKTEASGNSEHTLPQKAEII